MIEKIKELYKELYEDMQINIKIRQGLDEGKIKAEGTHQELLNSCKNYQNLYESELKNNK